MLNAVVAVIVAGLVAVGAAVPSAGPTSVPPSSTVPGQAAPGATTTTAPADPPPAAPGGGPHREVHPFGTARFLGSPADLVLAAPIVAMAVTPSGDGYWIAGADGGMFAYGDARFHGSVGAHASTAPIEDVVATGSGRGYWLAAADGAVFTFGDARFHGSAVEVALAAPVRAMAPTPTGDGYWLFAADGGVFDYGDAEFVGAGSGLPDNQRVADAAADPHGLGYWLAARRLPRLPLRGDFVPAVPRRPPLAVKIDNAGPATPQWGLERTDLVIEEIVEGEITRFVAVYHSRDAEAVGPVRSARTTDIDLLALLGRPLFAFSGGNQGVRDTVAAADVVDLNHGLFPGAYARRGGRPAPHNLLTSTDALRSLDPGAPPPSQVFTYRPPAADPAASAVAVQGIDLQVGGVSVGWRWDAASGRWLRWQRGAPHVSADGPQLGATNVVVMFTDYVPSGVDARSPEALSVGGGPAWVLVEGTVVGGRWSRASAGSQLQLLDDSGAPIGLVPGNTWLELPRPGTGTVVP